MPSRLGTADSDGGSRAPLKNVLGRPQCKSGSIRFGAGIPFLSGLQIRLSEGTVQILLEPAGEAHRHFEVNFVGRLPCVGNCDSDHILHDK